jgi:hypothetical protein
VHSWIVAGPGCGSEHFNPRCSAIRETTLTAAATAGYPDTLPATGYPATRATTGYPAIHSITGYPDTRPGADTPASYSAIIQPDPGPKPGVATPALKRAALYPILGDLAAGTPHPIVCFAPAFSTFTAPNSAFLCLWVLSAATSSTPHSHPHDTLGSRSATPGECTELQYLQLRRDHKPTSDDADSLAATSYPNTPSVA